MQMQVLTIDNIIVNYLSFFAEKMFSVKTMRTRLQTSSFLPSSRFKNRSSKVQNIHCFLVEKL